MGCGRLGHKPSPGLGHARVLTASESAQHSIHPGARWRKSQTSPNDALRHWPKHKRTAGRLAKASAMKALQTVLA